MGKIVVEEDHFLKILSVILDPETPETHKQAVQRFFAHDVPDFLTWCEDFRPRLPALYPCSVDYARDRNDFLQKVEEAGAAVVESLRVDEEVLRRAPKLRVIQKFGWITSNIDEKACRASGVAIERLRRVGNIAVAEQAFAFILVLAKRICAFDHVVEERSLRERGYEVRPRSPYIGYSNPAGITGLRTLYGSKLGIVGFGEIGREIALYGAAFGMEIGYFQRTRLSAEEEEQYGAKYEPLDDLVACSDYLVVQLPLNDSTRGLINGRLLRRTKKGLFLINVARAELVDRDALIGALRSGSLGGWASTSATPNQPCPTIRCSSSTTATSF